ncbi:hypothetical protein DFJ73DRAFT_867303 [Zopfochytrium polystomum]|nr:hypothetical protein DFJ73DRAFT_867303 [Zopfochytrium polystomum]
MNICDLPDEILTQILLRSASYALGRRYYILAVVCRTFHSILANPSTKDVLLRLHKHSLIAFIQSSCIGAPDLERVLIYYVQNTTDPDELRLIVEGYEQSLRHKNAYQPCLLNVAADHNYQSLARLLIARGADPNYRALWWGTKDYGHSSALWTAVKKDNLPMLRLLVHAGGECPFSGFYTAHSWAKSPDAHRLLLRSSDVYGPEEVLAAGIQRVNPFSVRMALALGALVSDQDFLDMVFGLLVESDADKLREKMDALLECTQLFIDAGLDVSDLLSVLVEGEAFVGEVFHYLVERGADPKLVKPPP